MAHAFGTFKSMSTRNMYEFQVLPMNMKSDNMHEDEPLIDRRELLSSLLGSAALIGSPLTSKASDETSPSADADAEAPKKSRFTTSQIQQFLQPIPTFTIVDPTGTPFMVVGEDAKLSAYFFTTYEEAARILSSANTATAASLKEVAAEQNAKRKAEGLKPFTKAEVEAEIGVNPWSNGNARISSVPLDFGVELASRGKIKGAYFRIAPAEDDVQDAIEIDHVDDLPEGKVPLFYFEDFEIDLGEKDGLLWSGNPNTKTKIPLCFSKGQLINEWKKCNPKAGKDDIPEVKVTELFSLLKSFVEAEKTDTDDDLEKLVLLAPPGSEGKAKACNKKGGKEQAFKLGERIVVL
jgi:hypothetical protein